MNTNLLKLGLFPLFVLGVNGVYKSVDYLDEPDKHIFFLIMGSAFIIISTLFAFVLLYQKWRGDKAPSDGDERHPELKPPDFEVTQRQHNGSKRTFPDFGFNLMNPNDSPMKVKVLAKPFLGGVELNPIPDYSDDKIFNLNPLRGIAGHTQIPPQSVDSTEKVELKITVTYIDQNGEEHKLLPVGYVYMRDKNDWYFDA